MVGRQWWFPGRLWCVGGQRKGMEIQRGCENQNKRFLVIKWVKGMTKMVFRATMKGISPSHFLFPFTEYHIPNVIFRKGKENGKGLFHLA